MKHRFILAAMMLAATVSCQKGETAIEFNLSDLRDGWIVDVTRIEGEGGNSIFKDTVQNSHSSFVIKCDSLTENTMYMVMLTSQDFRKRCMYRTIYVEEGSTVTVKGSGMHNCDWLITSTDPRQKLENALNDATRDIIRQLDDIKLFADTAKSDESNQKLYAMESQLYDQLQEKQLATMKDMPIDEFWLQKLRRGAGAINYYGTDYKSYGAIEELYKMIPEDLKNSKNGKALHQILYGKAPAVGDPVNDYDLYDAEGNVHHLADYKGKWLLLDFGSNYCGPCWMFAASIKYFYEKGIGKDFEIITINNNTVEDFVKKAAEDKYISPLFNDHQGNDGIFALNKIAGFPTFYLVNPEGIIEDIFMGVNLEKVISIMKSHGGFAAPEFKTENGATVITNPDFSGLNNTMLIDKVEIYKDSVVLNCTYPFCGGYKVVKETGLFVNGKCISKMTGSNIRDDDFTQVPMGKVGHCRLTFEPLPKGVTQIDFVEGTCENCFRVEGVRITE